MFLTLKLENSELTYCFMCSWFVHLQKKLHKYSIYSFSKNIEKMISTNS